MTAIEPRSADATFDPGAAGRLGALADARWSELDEARRIPDDLFDDVKSSGLVRTLVPRSMGGAGLAPVEWFRTGVDLARHDPSLAWVVTQGAAELGWIAAGADPAWAAEVLADPHGASASSTAGLGTVIVDRSGMRLRGRWSFNTGCHGATWIGGLSLVDARDGVEAPSAVTFGWVPADRAEILDDWDPSGMRGTGSNSTEIAEQDIDPAWTFNPFAPTTNDRGAHRCLVGNGNWPIATSVAAVQLGAARRALDEAHRIVVDKAPAPDFVRLVEVGAVQRALVRAEGRWAAHVAGVEAELDSLWADAARDGELSVARRVSLLSANVNASEGAAAIVTAMCEVTGTAAMVRSHPISRMRRDVEALGAHIAVNGATIEAAGRMHAGLIEPDIRV